MFNFKKSAFVLYLSTFIYGCGTTHEVTVTERVYTAPPAYVQAPRPTPPPPPPSSGEGTFQQFYDALSPYGQWVEDPASGYVWVPNAGPDFQPYRTNGHWAYTSYGWTWVSGYPWGWAAFHYGRWRFTDQYGWLWIPGHEWGPAWVAWRSNDAYFGWSPLGPHVNIDISVNLSNDEPRPEHWSFVPRQYVTSPQVENHYVAPRENVKIINRTTVINNTVAVNNVKNVTNNAVVNNVTNNNVTNNVTNNNTVNNTSVNNTNVNNTKTVYMAGPPPAEVEKATGIKVTPLKLTTTSQPGRTQMQGNQLAIYRPAIAPSSNVASESKAVPTNVIKLESVKPVSERAPGNEGLVHPNSMNMVKPSVANNQATQNQPIKQNPQMQNRPPQVSQVQNRPIASPYFQKRPNPPAQTPPLQNNNVPRNIIFQNRNNNINRPAPVRNVSPQKPETANNPPAKAEPMSVKVANQKSASPKATKKMVKDTSRKK